MVVETTSTDAVPTISGSTITISSLSTVGGGSGVVKIRVYVRVRIVIPLR